MRFGIREIMFFLVLLAVPVASFFYVFKPRNDEIRQARAEIEAKQATLNRLADAVAKIPDIGIEIENGKDQIAVIEAKLPSAQDVEGILEQVTQLARKNRLNSKSVKSEKPVPAAAYMELPLKIMMEGEFDGFYQFLIELENLPRITRIHQLKLERVTGKNPEDTLPPGSMKAEFTLSIYFESQTRVKS